MQAHALMSPRSTARPPAAAALSAYGNTSLAARIEGASPHRLVQMLYDRLHHLTGEARKAALAGDSGRRLNVTASAIAIVDGLDATLDDRHGGEVATSLHEIYRLLSDRLLNGSPAALAEAETAISIIADAWRTIGRKPHTLAPQL